MVYKIITGNRKENEKVDTMIEIQELLFPKRAIFTEYKLPVWSALPERFQDKIVMKELIISYAEKLYNTNKEGQYV